METKKNNQSPGLTRERVRLLKRLDNFLDPLMVFLGFVWLILLIIELVWKLSKPLQTVGTTIWIIFIVDFIIKLLLAPQKLVFLRKNILSIISLFVPALRFLRITRFIRVIKVLRAGKGIRLIRVLSSINRGIRALSTTMQRRAFGYVFTISLIVLVMGSAGMFTFERDVENGFQNYWQALWWTAMLLTSMGSEYWPKSAAGQTLCFVIAIYGFAVFGYFTAFLATFFLGQDARNKSSQIAGAAQIKEIEKEVRELRMDLRQVLSLLQKHEDSR